MIHLISTALPLLFPFTARAQTENTAYQNCYVRAQIVSAVEDQTGMYAEGVTQCVDGDQVVYEQPVSFIITLNGGANEALLGSEITYQVTEQTAPYPASQIASPDGAEVTWAQYGGRRGGTVYRRSSVYRSGTVYRGGNVYRSGSVYRRSAVYRPAYRPVYRGGAYYRGGAVYRGGTVYRGRTYAAPAYYYNEPVNQGCDCSGTGYYGAAPYRGGTVYRSGAVYRGGAYYRGGAVYRRPPHVSHYGRRY